MHAHGPAGQYGPNPYVGPEQGKNGQGCMIAAIVGIVLVLALVIGILLLVALTGEDEAAPSSPVEDDAEEDADDEVDEGDTAADTADDGALPECVAYESGLLTEHVPNPDVTTDEVESGPSWEGRDCQWNSASLGFGDLPGFAAVLVYINEDTNSTPAEEVALDDLARDESDFDTEPVDGLGDQASAWYDEGETLGCVGVATGVAYVRTCYDQQADGEDWGTIAPDDAVDVALELAVEFTEVVESHAD